MRASTKCYNSPMSKKWEFFSSPAVESEDKNEQNKKTSGKFLNWISSLLKKKEESQSLLNLSEDRLVEENLKQEIASIPEEDRAETESFLAEEISRIEKRRDDYQLELGDEVSFGSNSGWYVSDIKKDGELFEIRRSRKDPKGREVLEKELARKEELSLPAETESVEAGSESAKEEEEKLPAESFANKFKLGEKVSYSGEFGWKVEGIAGNQVEIGRIKKDFRGRDVYERKIVKDDEVLGPAQHENLAFKIGDEVSVKGEPGWDVVSLSGEDGKYLEVGKVRADKKGALVFERKIVEVREVEKK